jgi:hypothetical protein
MEGRIIENVGYYGTLMWKKVVNINSVYDVIILRRKYSEASNEKISQRTVYHYANF